MCVRERERDVRELDGFHTCTLGEDITIQTIVEKSESEGESERESARRKREQACLSPPLFCARALSAFLFLFLPLFLPLALLSLWLSLFLGGIFISKCCQW